nr:MAG TPA: tail collar fiber protein [Caudoviricetes sp.]
MAQTKVAVRTATQVTLADLVDYWQSDAVQTQPDYTTLKSQGFPTNGNPTTGLAATLPGSAWFALLSAMRVSVIKAAGLTPESTPNPLQFLTALQSLGWVNSKSIQTDLLADSAITEAKILDAAISFVKLKSDVLATSEEAIAGSINNKLMTPIRVKEAITAQTPPALPTGSFIYYGGIDVPDGYLLCNGANVSRTTYANLFAVIGTKYGEGDGVTTFTLPNLDGRVLQGTNDTGEVGTYLEAQLPNITGSIIPGGGGPARHIGMGEATGAFTTGTGTGGGGFTVDAGPITMFFTASNSNNIYNGSTVQVPSLQTLICIKT